MAQGTYGAGSGCAAPVPTLLSATPGHHQVTVAWSAEHGADPQVTGYRLYYDQAGKEQLVAEIGLLTTYTDLDLSDGEEYCYEVTSAYPACESGLSNTLCATPQPGGGPGLSVLAIETGYFEGKGKNKVWVPATTFSPGDSVVLRALVVDESGLPLAGAVVDLDLNGPESNAVTSQPSSAAGLAAAAWRTSAPNKQGQGGTPVGSYTATTVNVTLDGYTWDSVATSVTFDLE